MQKGINIIHIEQVTKDISMIFMENKETHKRDFLIEVKEADSSIKKYKSIFYIERFPLYEKREIISKWNNNTINNEELICNIKG